VTRPNRRRILGGLAGTAALGFGGFPTIAAGGSPKVAVIGGGFGGATTAKYLRLLDRRLDVTLIEKDASYVSCPFSNLVLAGMRELRQISHSQDPLIQQYGVRIVRDRALAIDPAARRVKLRNGADMPYDRLVLAPGIDLRFDAVEGYDAAAAALAPHAWKAGPQTMLLQRQLQAMPDGGLVIIAPPANPFRCPPGPYERAGLIANYLQRHKPKSKLLILDAKDSFAKQALFEEGWQRLYPGMIEWLSGSTGGKVSRIDAKTLTLETEFGSRRGAVVNFIPPQRAGAIAGEAGLADKSGWCPVDPRTLESALQPNVHILGDAIEAGAMPKSASSANSQAKICAAAIVAALAGEAPEAPSFSSTCYSFLAPNYAVSVTGGYRLIDGVIAEVPHSGGVSPLAAPASRREQEALFAEGWYSGITEDSFG